MLLLLNNNIYLKMKPKRSALDYPAIQKLPVDSPPKTKHTRLPFVNSTPRYIYPPIPIQHGEGNRRFYQCSSCGLTAARARSDWHSGKPCSTDKILFNHHYEVATPPKAQLYLVMVENLYRNDVPIELWQKQKLKAEYATFFNEFMQSRLNPPQKNQIIEEVKQVKNQSNELRQFMIDQNMFLETLLQKNRMLTATFKTQGYQVPAFVALRQQNIQEVIEMVMPAFTLHIKSILTNHFSTKKQIDPEVKEFVVKQIQEAIYKINVVDSYSSWRMDVQSALSQKLKRSQSIKDTDSGKKEEKRQKNAAKFLKNVNYNILRNKRMFIEVLRRKSRKVQIAAVGLLNYMKSQGFQVPDVSNKTIRRQTKRTKRNISVHLIKKKVLELKACDQLTLACDLYFAFCMSVRLNDLTRIYIKRIIKDECYDYVSILENKNNHQTTRVVPVSLKKLIFLSRNSYPITEDRLLALKQFCHAQFGGFYLLRSSSITAVLSGLMSASSFSPHHVSTTTLRYYVNYEDYDLMNNIFSIEIDQVPEVHWKRSYKRLYIGKIGDVTKEYSCDKQNMFETQFDFPSTNIPRQEQSLDNLHQKCIFDQSILKYKTESIQFSKSKSDLLNLLLCQQDCKYFQSLMFSNFSFFKLLACMINNFLIVIYDGKQICFHPSTQYLSKAENKAAAVLQIIQKDQCNQIFVYNETLNESKVIQQIQQFQKQYKEKFEPIEIEDQQYPQILKDNSSRVLANQKNESKLVLVVGGEQQLQQFAVIKNQQIHKIQNHRKKSQRLLKAQNCKRYILMKSESCKMQCRGNLDTVSCLNCSNMRTVCECCPNTLQCVCEKIHKPFKKQFVCSSYSANTKYGIIDEKYKTIPIDKKQRNNLKMKVQSSKRQYLKRMASSQSLDYKLYLPWEIVTNQIVMQIKFIDQNEDYLPLKITYISKEKQYGVTATQNIEKETIIGRYLGVVRSSLEANPRDDSLLSIGWFKRLQYFICCDQASNYGRFLNAAKQKSKANCYLRLALVQNYGFCPYFVAKQNIYEGDELEWFYGNKYVFE